MLKAVHKTFSVKLGRRVFVCLRNDELPPGLRKKVRPLVVGTLACWVDRLHPDSKPA
jgi:hypothetical protein